MIKFNISQLSGKRSRARPFRAAEKAVMSTLILISADISCEDQISILANRTHLSRALIKSTVAKLADELVIERVRPGGYVIVISHPDYETR
jgi:hypothetical protein